MIDVKNIQSIYFIGIGGIGMSALARYFLNKGVSVAGYDKVETVITKNLIKEGAKIHFKEDVNLLPKHIDAIVYTPAIPTEHKELKHFEATDLPLLKRAEMLAEITKDNFTIAVAGTHGKTTISTMIAHVLKDTGYDCTAFLGGISLNYHTNFLAGKNDVVVIEADEYDKSFLQLHPNIAVISSMDADHLDVYGEEENLHKTFAEFVTQIKPKGKLIANKLLKQLAHGYKRTYSARKNANYFAHEIAVESGLFQFNVKGSQGNVSNLQLALPGRHNVENATAAIAVALELGIDSDKIASAIKSFKGIKRRFDVHINNDQQVYVDDYAHHPEEIFATVDGVRELFPNRHITVVFQPHLYSRTNDFADGFAVALDDADDVILLPIYPARELPIEGVSSQMILDRMENPNRMISDKDVLLDVLEEKEFDVLLTIGAGDIDQLVEPIKNFMNEEV